MNATRDGLLKISFPTARAVALVLLALALGGCPAKKPGLDAGAGGRVVIKGSNTFGEELAPHLIAEYRRDHPNVTVTLESKGSATGIAALLAGECDIAATSREVTPQEAALARARGIELKEHMIGFYGVAVIVKASNPVERLTAEQVRAIFTGAVKNWREVGGPDRPIVLAIRDPVSDTNLGFRELAMDNRPYAADAGRFKSYAQLAAAVAQEEGGIGYSGMQLAGLPGIRALRIGDTEPTTLAVNEGWYPYTRRLRLHTNALKETAPARDFLRFVQRGRGQAIIEEMGFVRRFENRLDALIPQ